MIESDLAQMFREMGISKATLKQVAKLLENDPQLIKLFQNQLNNKDFEKSINEMYDELNEVFNHGKKSPNS